MIDDALPKNVEVYEKAKDSIAYTDFYSILPQGKYLYLPTRDLWPPESVTARLGIEQRKRLDSQRAAVQMTWHPSEPLVIHDRIVADGGWVRHPGVNVVNLYRAPGFVAGDPAKADMWRDHLRFIYPDDADHVERWLAHRVQRPGQKLNHALVLGGGHGIGKDSLLDPVKFAVGHWNWSEINPAQMMGRFNGWAKSVIVRVSEARDLGDVDRFGFYDHSKVYISSPPDVLRVDEKNLREHAVFNVVAVIITTNHKTDGIYLPPEDRRHFVAWSERSQDSFGSAYFPDLWGWYESGGFGHVAAFLRSLDLAGFNPKAAPPRTPAWHAIVAAGAAPEDVELRDVIEADGAPEAITIERVISLALGMDMAAVADEFRDRKHRRAIPHKMERAGYVPVRNPDSGDGRFKLDGRNVVIYARKTLSIAEQIRAARRLASP